MVVSCKGTHFPQEIVLRCVRWDVAYPLSYRHVDQPLDQAPLLLERGVSEARLHPLTTGVDRTRQPCDLCLAIDLGL